MYISRIKLNTKLRHTIIALSNPNIFHGAVETSLGNTRKRSLWRIDKLQNNLYLLIVSSQRPDLSLLQKQFGFPNEQGECKDYNPLLDKVVEGSVWSFKLTANPTTAVKKGLDLPENSRGIVMSAKSAVHQIEWLQKKAPKIGIEIQPDEVSVINDKSVSFKKSSGHKVTFQSVTYIGKLKVTDPGLFKESLCSGIGRERSYGQGMITIVRT